MTEILVIGSNIVVVVLIGWLIRKVNAQETKCSEHMVTIAKGFAVRPEFDEMDERIDRAIKSPEGKITLLREEFRGHRHEGSDAKVVLGQ